MATKKRLDAALSVMLAQTDKIDEWFDAQYRRGSGDYETWGAKDLIAHSAEYTKRQALRLSGQEVESSHGSGDFNRVLFDRHADTTWSDAVELLQNSIKSLVGEVAHRSESELISDDGPSDSSKPVWRGIAFYGIVHNFTHIAMALVRSDSPEAAIRFQQVLTAPLLAIDASDDWRATIEFNVGRALALANDPSAIDHIKIAIATSPEAARWVGGDPDLESIRMELER